MISKDIIGVSCSCAEVFNATKDAVDNKFELIKENLVPGTSGLPSIGKLLKSGATILTF